MQVTLTDYEEPVLLNLQACMAANLASSGHHAESDSHGSPDLSSRCLNSSILNGAENIGAHVKGQCSGSSDTCGNSKETAKMLWQTVSTYTVRPKPSSRQALHSSCNATDRFLCDKL